MPSNNFPLFPLLLGFAAFLLLFLTFLGIVNAAILLFTFFIG